MTELATPSKQAAKKRLPRATRYIQGWASGSRCMQTQPLSNRIVQAGLPAIASAPEGLNDVCVQSNVHMLFGWR